MIAYIKDDVLNDNKSFIQAVCIKYDGKYEPIEFLPLSSYSQSVNETKPTISKMESVDNYRDKWQKLKEWLNDRMEHYNDCLNENVLISSERQEVLSARYNQCFETIAQMEYIEKELEGEDEI